MRRFPLIALIALVLLPLAPARAEAVTVRDIIELTRAGLGDDVLLALIEVDRSVFSIDTQTIIRLKQAGVSERVIEAMVRSGRTPDVQVEEPVPSAAEAPITPPPPVVVIDHQETVREVPVPVAVPVYVPVVERRGHDRIRDIDPTRAGQEADIDRDRDRDDRKAQPVYWGFGGKLRPDAWKPR